MNPDHDRVSTVTALCRECRRPYAYRGDPETAADSRKWEASDRSCVPCLRAKRKPRGRELQPQPELDELLRGGLRDP